MIGWIECVIYCLRLTNNELVTDEWKDYIFLTIVKILICFYWRPFEFGI